MVAYGHLLFTLARRGPAAATAADDAGGLRRIGVRYVVCIRACRVTCSGACLSGNYRCLYVGLLRDVSINMRNNTFVFYDTT